MKQQVQAVEEKEGEWPSLLYRDPPFPSVPPFDFFKFPGTPARQSHSCALALKMGKLNLSLRASKLCLVLQKFVLVCSYDINLFLSDVASQAVVGKIQLR